MFSVFHTWRTESETDLSRREDAMGTRCKKIIGARGIALRLDLDDEAARETSDKTIKIKGREIGRVAGNGKIKKSKRR